jgi:hypothetical protein
MTIISGLIINGCQTKKQDNLREDNLSLSSEIQEQILENIYNKQKDLQLCDGEIDKSFSKKSSSVYPLNKEEYLVEIMCFLAAYQGNYQYFLYKINAGNVTIQPLYFQEFIRDNNQKINLKNIRSLGGSPSYDPQTQVLTIYTKGRGLADCGSFSQYQWEQSRFELKEYRLKSECDGNYLEPENYPQVYP